MLDPGTSRECPEPMDQDLDDETLVEYPEFRPFIIGVVERCGLPPAICYDRSAIIAYLTHELGDHDSAEEHFAFNVLGGYVGPTTPFFLDRTMVAALRGGAPSADGPGTDS